MMNVVVVVAVALAAGPPVSIPLDVKLRAGFRVTAPVGREAALIDDAKDGKLDKIDLATAALIASGVKDSELDEVKAGVMKATSTARQQAQTQKTPKKKGDRLLRTLHDTVLRRYVETQSDVAAVVRSGEFNCLSSAVLFLIAAEGLVDAPRGMLSKTHAFARVDVDGKVADVETTTKGGFAVDRKKLVTLDYLKTLGVGDGLTDAERLADLQHPAEVPLTGLIAALYSNRGVMLVRAGDVEGAAVAFDRATRIAQGEQRARVAEWRAALLNNATQRLMDDGRLDDAKALLALALDGAAGSTRAALLQNLANVAVAQSQQERSAGRLREARALLDEAMATGTTSTTMRQQIASAAADLDGQLAADSGDESKCAALKSSSEQQRCFVSASQGLALKGKVSGALSAARAARGLDDTASPKDPNVASVLFNALVLSIRQADKDSDCPRVEALARDVVTVSKSMKNTPAFPAAQVMGQCWWSRASAAIEKHDDDVAAALFARALVHLPNDQGLRGNLREMDLRRAHTLAKAGRCDEARPFATRADLGGDRDDEGRGRQLLELCANERAVAHAKSKDWAGAVAELRRGLLDAPGSTVLDDNLGRMLHNLTLDFLKSKRCDDASALVPELKARKQTEIVDNVADHCR
ncbi:MAG: hypothetical protein Q8O67_10405 [Deltaproteobacteria bacterium]|nr:hypothetical protein [Deltaproteobacteria bacterium]